MSSDYVGEVRLFGGPAPFIKDGQRYNLKHEDDIDPSKVRTDGMGNVQDMPLLRGKPCFGRPERWARTLAGPKPYFRDGELEQGDTTCDTCRDRSPNTFAACGQIVDERLRSNPSVQQALDVWIRGAEHLYGEQAFQGLAGRLWESFMLAISDHGGWTNKNNELVKLHAIREAEVNKQRENELRKQRRAEQRAAHRGPPAGITGDFIQQLEAEAIGRANKLKAVVRAAGGTNRQVLPAWAQLKPHVCERIAEVWKSQLILERAGKRTSGQNIATLVSKRPPYDQVPFTTLRARVYDDLKRIAKLESGDHGDPIWPKWTYASPTTTQRP
jgi:hypothetical protein